MLMENFNDMGKEIVNQLQETQRAPYRTNPRKNMSRHILIKLIKTNKNKYKRKIKEARENQQITYKEIPMRLIGGFSAETLQAGQRGGKYLQ